jgi:CHRD domain
MASRLPRIALLISLVSIFALASAADVSVVLTGEQEVPPVSTAARGTGTLTLSADHTLSGTITTTGIDGTMAHIHQGAPGKSGKPIINLEKGADGKWSVPAGTKLTDAQYQSFEAGDLYVNVHSDAHKGGEIRGQLKP